MDEPILIVMMGRSGSSLTAGIFANHGVWVGKQPNPSEINPKGFFENKELKTTLRNWFGMSYHTIPDPIEGWRGKVEQIITKQGYTEGPWLYKHGANFWKVWNEFNPKWVLVWREPEAILRSIRRARILNKFSDEEIRHSIALHHQQMGLIKNVHGAVDVYPDEVVKGDHTSIANAIEYCGIEYNPYMF